MNSRRAWLVFAAGTFAYLVAVTQRTSMGVATVEAADRFGASATGLAFFGMLQLGVYAGCQLPVGLLMDRFGARRLIVAGIATTALGQAVVAFAPVLAVAVAGRVLVGAGDAALFVSVLRLLPAWFTGRWLRILPQWLATTGQAGQLLSAIPFVSLLGIAGWTNAFLLLAAFSVLATVVAALAIHDRPAGSVPPARGAGGSFAALRAAAREPGTWLGYFTHSATHPSVTVFTLMWGYPMLVLGLGLDAPAAAGVLTVAMVASIALGPLVIAPLAARFPARLSDLVLIVMAVILAAWLMILLWPGHPPVAVLVIFCIAIGAGGPSSVIAFEFARQTSPLARLGSANAIVNMGGFVMCVVLIFIMGVILDAVPRLAPSADRWVSFQWASAAQLPLLAGAALAVLLLRRRVRARRRAGAYSGFGE